MNGFGADEVLIGEALYKTRAHLVDEPTDEVLQDGLFWTIKPNRTGADSFFCRIDHEMRGAIKV